MPHRDVIDHEVSAYAEAHTTPTADFMTRLARETHTELAFRRCSPARSRADASRCWSLRAARGAWWSSARIRDGITLVRRAG